MLPSPSKPTGPRRRLLLVVMSLLGLSFIRIGTVFSMSSKTEKMLLCGRFFPHYSCVWLAD